MTTPVTCVIADGPYPDCDPGGDEYPVWYVFLSDDDGEEVGGHHTCYNREAAIDLGERIARARKVEFVCEVGYA